MQIGEEKAGGALVIAPVGRVDSVSSGELEKLVVVADRRGRAARS